MELTKSLVAYLYEQVCYTCKWSNISPIDWGLMCCNGDSEHCTDYCPSARCGHYEPEHTCKNCKHGHYFAEYSMYICGKERTKHHRCPCPEEACEHYEEDAK